MHSKRNGRVQQWETEMSQRADFVAQLLCIWSAMCNVYACLCVCGRKSVHAVGWISIRFSILTLIIVIYRYLFHCTARIAAGHYHIGNTYTNTMCQFQCCWTSITSCYSVHFHNAPSTTESRPCWAERVCVCVECACFRLSLLSLVMNICNRKIAMLVHSLSALHWHASNISAFN